MTAETPPPLLCVRGPLGETLAAALRERIAPLLAPDRCPRVRMVISSDASEPIPPLDPPLLEVSGDGASGTVRWSACGPLDGVIRRLRLELVRRLGPADLQRPAWVALWLDAPVEAVPAPPLVPEGREPAAPPRERAAPPRAPLPAGGLSSGPALPGNLYQAYYGFERMPFNNTPDTFFYYPSEKHQEALSRLIYAVSERKGFVLISGEIGAGKSTLCRALLARIPRTVRTAVVVCPPMDGDGLLRAIAEDLGLETHGLATHDVVRDLHAYLVREMAAGATVCIVIDEAQNLPPEALETVRMLSNLETEQEKLVQIILMGQPNLRETLRLPQLAQLRQRIAVQYHLEPLSPAETAGYIEHRLRLAGPARRVRFVRSAVREVDRYSGGVPRLINTLCDGALLTGYLRRTTRITAAMVREAARDLDLAPRRGGWAQFFRFW